MEIAWRYQWLFLVPLKGGRDYITPQKAIYKWYILPIGGLYSPYHLLREPETPIEDTVERNPAKHPGQVIQAVTFLGW